MFIYFISESRIFQSFQGLPFYRENSGIEIYRDSKAIECNSYEHGFSDFCHLLGMLPWANFLTF